jgi:hypothetical protein
LHNYPAASSTTQKNYNWSTLNRKYILSINWYNLEKVFKKIGFQLSKKEIQDIISCKPMSVENLLKKTYKHIQKFGSKENFNQNNLSNNQSNQSYDNKNLNLSDNDNYTKINKSHTGINSMAMDGSNYNMNEFQFKKIIEQKDSQIEELRNIIDVI